VEALGPALRAGVRWAQGGQADSAAAGGDRRPRPSTPARGTRAGSDGATRRRGSTVPRAVETVGHRWALQVTAADAQDRSPGRALAENVPEGTGAAVAVALGDQGAPGAPAAPAQPMRLAVGQLPEAQKGVGRLSRR
jgi:hypothetical protein